MKNRLSCGLAMLMACSIIFVGCSQTTNEADQEKAKEFSATEVIAKANERVKKQKGVSYHVEGKQKVENSGSTIQTEFKADVDLVNEPKAMYAKGQQSSFGMKMPTELYMVDGILYENMLGDWMKIPVDESPTGLGGSPMAMGENIMSGQVGEVPSEILNNIDALLKSLGTSKDLKGVTMKKDKDTYVINLDSAAFGGNKELLDQQLKDRFEIGKFNMDEKELKEMEKEFQELEKEFQGTGFDIKELMIDFSKVKIDSYKSSIYIHATTFELTGLDEEVKINLPNGNQGFLMEISSKAKVKGSFDGKIVVPEEVKKKAEQFEKEFEEGL